jgi:hypothetical protein
MYDTDDDACCSMKPDDAAEGCSCDCESCGGENGENESIITMTDAETGEE